MNTSRLLSAVAALAVLAGGVWHLLLWFDRYRDLSSQIPGVEVVKLGFPANAALSVAGAVALIAVVSRAAPALGALALQVGSVLALVDSRTATLLGWEEKTWDSAAIGVLVLELIAVAVLLADLARRLRKDHEVVPVNDLVGHTVG